MPNNRVKTSKALQSKKGKAALAKLHPHSRRAQQLARVALRTDKIQNDRKERRRVEMASVDRLLWFCNALDPDLPSIPLTSIHSLIHDFISRHDDAIAEEQRQRRPGRPKSAKQDKLEAEKKREEEEYKAGIVLPDLTSPEAVLLLRQWADRHAGDPSFFPRLRLIRTSAIEPESYKVEQEGAVDKVTFGVVAAEGDRGGMEVESDEEEVQVEPQDGMEA